VTQGNPGINNVHLSGAFVIGAWRDFGFFVIGHVLDPATGDAGSRRKDAPLERPTG
jgi:hypothetical protein